MITVFFFLEACGEEYVGEGVLIRQLLAHQLASDLASVEKENTKAHKSANHKHRNVRGVNNSAYLIGLAILSESGQAREADDAESEENGAKNNEHIVGYAVDNELKPVAVFIVADKCAGKYETNQSCIYGITCIYQSHTDLWFEA